MSLLKVNEVQNYNGSSLTLTASTVSTSAQLNTGGNISVTGSINVSDDSTTRSNLGLGSIATQDANSVALTGGSLTGTEIDLKSSGTTIFASDGTTSVISESAGTVTLTADELIVNKDLNGDPELAHLYNASTGTAAEATVYITNSATKADGLFLQQTGSSFTTTGGFKNDGSVIGSGTGASGGLSIMTRATADIRFYTNGHTNERMRIDSNGNLLVGTQTSVARSTFYGTTSTGANAAIGIIDDEGDRATIGLTTIGNLYITAEDGEIVAVDSAGNSTVLSPHNFEMIPDGASESGAWAFYSRNGDTENDLGNTTYVNVDMMKVIRLVENLTGVKLLYTGSGTDADTSTVTQNIIESQQSQIDALTARIEALETA